MEQNILSTNYQIYLERMNDKEGLIYTILDMVIEESSLSFVQVTRDDIIGKNGNEIVRMARCIFVTELLFFWYSDCAIYTFINRTRQALDDILFRAHEYRRKSWIYRKTEAKCTLRCEELQNNLE